MPDSLGEDLVAIVGISCRFAGCVDLRDFWLRILSGKHAFSDNADPEAARFLSLDASSFGHVTTLRGGYLKDLWQINPSAIDIPPSSLSGVNPEYALTSDLVQQALKSTDYSIKSISRDRIGLILGYSPQLGAAEVNWCQHGIVIDQTLDIIRRCFPHGSTEQFESLRKSLLSALPQYDSRNIHTLFSQAMLGIIADHFDICGPSFLINAGTTSSHLSIQAGCDALLSRRADMVIAGGVQSVVSPQHLMPFSKLGLLSKSETTHPYGRDADGILLGEGAGIVILKRLEDAIRDEDRIYSIVRGVSAASSGSNIKNGNALVSSVKNACKQSGTPASSVKLIEGEGSAFPQQDKDEIKALASVYSGSGKLEPGTVALGSVKGLIGHTGSASGIAGIIKTVLSLYHRIIPPSQEAERPTDLLKQIETPFYLNMAPRPWIHNDQGLPRRAAVTSMTYTGDAACVILEQFRGHK